MFGFKRNKKVTPAVDTLEIHPEILAIFNRPRFVSASPDDARINARIAECNECAR